MATANDYAEHSTSTSSYFQTLVLLTKKEEEAIWQNRNNDYVIVSFSQSLALGDHTQALHETRPNEMMNEGRAIVAVERATIPFFVFCFFVLF